MPEVVVLFPPRAAVNAERLLALGREFELGVALLGRRIEVGPARPLSHFQQQHANDSIELLGFQTATELDQLVATLALEQSRAADIIL